MRVDEKYSDILCQWLVAMGYTHCFTVAGGNIMHLQESASRYFTLVPVVHEVAAGIAVEYFNECGLAGKAFALVTAGPGLTNIVTAMGGAFVESRELLVIGGQVKTADLSRGKLRQRGIQEIDGVSLVRSICKAAYRMETPWSQEQFATAVSHGFTGRKGPIFIEMPLDIQGRMFGDAVPDAALDAPVLRDVTPPPASDAVAPILASLRAAKRPIVLLGGGISRAVATELLDALAVWGVPLTTTWNGLDRIPADHPLYFGRPNTWGQRYANLLLQQADVVLALGTRLGMQQTGFNWQQFAPLAEVIHVDIDPAELEKEHPKTAQNYAIDANYLLQQLVQHKVGDYREWIAFCQKVKAALPLVEMVNTPRPEFISPYDFCRDLSELCQPEDAIVPCSSGSANTVMMQTFAQKRGQVCFNSKGAASMGYGLSGAIGVALAGHGRRTILIEGDGGFAQNIQEIGTVAVNQLPMKIFIFDDHGYASIRMTQRNYFGGRYVGCDPETGLGLPEWETLFAAYGVPVMRLTPDYQNSAEFHALFNAPGPAAFLVPVDPLQTYFPKITSRVLPNGGMESNPLHLMSPPLDDALYQTVATYLIEQPS